MNIKRAPLWGRMINILIIILLLITTCTSIYFKNECRELGEINHSLNTTIDKLESERDDLLSQLNEMANDKSTKEIKNLGNFKISAYCNCKKCCGKWSGGPTKSGTIPQAGRTIAVDPQIIPLGSKVVIDGHTYIAEDTGSAIKGKRIDVFFSSHQDALNFGIQYKDVSII